MTLPTFPAELDKPMRDSFAMGTGETRRLFQPEAAPLVPRARYSTASKPVAMTLIVDRNGLAVFDNFYQYTLGNGASPFLMPDPSTDGWGLLDADGNPLLLGGDGAPLLLAATWVCMFGAGLPERRMTGRNFSISFGLAVMP